MAARGAWVQIRLDMSALDSPGGAWEVQLANVEDHDNVKAC